LSSRRRHTRSKRDWSSDVCSSDLVFEKNINGRLACNDAAGKWLFKNKKYTVIKNGIFLNKYTFNTSTRKSIRENIKFQMMRFLRSEERRVGKEYRYVSLTEQ